MIIQSTARIPPYDKGYLFNQSSTAFYWNDEIKQFYYLDMAEVKTTSDLKGKLKAEITEFQPRASFMSPDGRYIGFHKSNGSTNQYPIYLYNTQSGDYYTYTVSGIANISGKSLRLSGENIEVVAIANTWSPLVIARVPFPANPRKHSVAFDPSFEGSEIKSCDYLNDYFKKGSGSLNAPLRDNHTFLGWYSEKTGGTKIEALSDLSDENSTLYAHWSANLKFNNPAAAYICNRVFAAVYDADGAMLKIVGGTPLYNKNGTPSGVSLNQVALTTSTF